MSRSQINGYRCMYIYSVVSLMMLVHHVASFQTAQRINDNRLLRTTSASPRRTCDIVRVFSQTERVYDAPLSTQDSKLISKSLTLLPVSREPLLFTSSQPLFTQEECRLVSCYLEHVRGEDESLSQHEISMGQRLLRRAHKQIDDLTGCPAHSGENPLPNYVTYEKEESNEEHALTKTTIQRLIPDGLHVDTNNGKLFRHLTALLYLTSNDTGATTFPLAHHLDRDDDKDTSAVSTLEKCRQAAKRLIESNTQHTLVQRDDENNPDARILEKATLKLFLDHPDFRSGVRMLAKAGYLCVFYNLDANGQPDPNSFHGGEALLGHKDKEKKALAFFKEIPLGTFQDQNEFAQKVREIRRYLVDRYFR